MSDLHLSGHEVEQAIGAATAGLITIGAMTHVATTGVQTPANATYNQADQTALANAVIAIAAKVNAIIDAAT